MRHLGRLGVARFARLGQTAKDVAFLSSGALVSQVVLAVGQLAAAHLYTDEQYGHFGVIVAWANIAAVIATMRYEMAIPLAETDEEAAALTRLCLLTSTICTLVLFAGLVLAHLTGWGHTPGAWWGVPFVLWGTAVFTALRMFASRLGSYARVGRAGVSSAVVQVAIQLGFPLAGLPGGLVTGQGVGRIVNAAHIGLRGVRRPGASMRAAAVRWRRMPLLNTAPALLNVISVGAVAPLIARWFGVAVAGQFSFATRLLAAPAVLLGQAVSQVMFPKLARLDREAGGVATEVRRATVALVLVALPVFSVVWLLGPELFALVFRQEWRAAGVLAAIMAPWLAGNFVSSPLASYATVRDQLGRLLFIALAEASARLLGLYLGVLTGSSLVGLTMYSLAGLVITTVFTIWVLHLAHVPLGAMARELAVPVGLSAAVGFGCLAVRLLGASTWAVVTVGVVGLALVSAVCGRRLLTVLRGTGR